MKKIDLEEIILEAYGCVDAHEFQRDYDISMQMIKEISLEAIKQVLELAANNAKIEFINTGECKKSHSTEDGKHYTIDKKSILKTITQII
jgi:hypothetical protein